MKKIEQEIELQRRKNNMTLKEELVFYRGKETVSVMSMEQALKRAMPLEESYRIMKEKIHQDFPNYVFE